MDFRHLLFYIGYLRVSNANSACINSKNFDLLSIPFSPICFSSRKDTEFVLLKKTNPIKNPNLFRIWVCGSVKFFQKFN